MADYTGTTIYKQGDTIAANAFTGEEKNITLYAVWTDDISELPLLSERVKVGDYVNYPVYYDNVYTNNRQNKASLTGWRVLSKDVDIDGNPAPGTVNLVSAGVPLTYYHYNNAETSIKKLAINFLKIPFGTAENYTFRKNGFNPYLTLTEVFNNKYTATYESDTEVSYTSTYDNGTTSVTYTGTKSTGDLKVRSMTKEDLDKVYDPTGERKTSRGTYVSDGKFEKLLVIPCTDSNSAYYWLASAYSHGTLWYVSHGGVVINLSVQGEFGVRPVVSLKPDVRTTGTDRTGSWDIEIEKTIENYIITYNANNGTMSGATTKVVTLGETYGELPEITREGYTFLGWYNENDEKIESTTIVPISDNHTLTAKWSANTGIEYTVKHYLMNLNETSYALAKTTTGTGTAGETINLANQATQITGGTYSKGSITENGTAVTETTIAGDGSTTIYLYYTRAEYTLTLNAGVNIASVAGAGTYKYGTNVIINSTLESEEGYTYNFVDWISSDTKLLANQSEQNAVITMPAGNITLTAIGNKDPKNYIVTLDGNGGTVERR